MTTAGDFIRLPKTDYHRLLDTGMRASSYISWAGFYIPELSAQDIEEYTKLRIKTEKDVLSLISLSLSEAQAEFVNTVNGTIDMGLQDFCESPAGFVALVQKAQEKYSDRLDFIPYLGINSDSNVNIPLATSFLSSGLFKGVDVYGKIVTDNPEYYWDAFEEVRRSPKNLKINFNCKYVTGRQQLEKIIEIAKPASLSDFEDMELAAGCEDLISQNNLELYISPVSDDYQKIAGLIRRFLDSKILVKISTKSILYTNKSLSDFASSLCNTDILTKEEVSSLFC